MEKKTLISEKPSHNSEIWVIAEPGHESMPSDATFELLAKATELAGTKSSLVAAVLIGENAGEWIKDISRAGIRKFYLAEGPEFAGFHDEFLAETVVGLAKEHKPEIILGAATIRGRSLMPRIAVLLGTGLTADCTGLEICPASGKLLQTRPAFGGNLLATILCERFPQMATVRPHVFKKAERCVVSGDCGGLEIVRCENTSVRQYKQIVRCNFSEKKEISLADARAIVAAGMGTGGANGIKLVRRLAEVLNAGVAASRSVVDSGWLDYSHQVGQTGITVHPSLYIACGISGAVQHLAGMQNSEFIIAINKDPDAPIFSIADAGVAGDLNEILPALISALEKSNCAV